MAVPCRPQKTFTLFVLDVPEDLPVDDIRHSLYRFNSVVEVVRLVVHYSPTGEKIEGNINQIIHLLLLRLQNTIYTMAKLLYLIFKFERIKNLIKNKNHTQILLRENLMITPNQK